MTAPREPVDRDADLEALARVDVVALPPGVRLNDIMKQRDEALRLCREARDERDAWKTLHVEEAKPHINDLYQRLQGVEADRDLLLTEIQALRAALANARAYIPRGPSVDAADLLADIDALLEGGHE